MGIPWFDSKAERWRTAKGIDTHRWSQSGNEFVKFPLDRLRRGIELAHDSVGDELHHLAEGLCGEDVNVKALCVFIVCLYLFKYMVNQSGFADASGCHQCYIASV